MNRIPHKGKKKCRTPNKGGFVKTPDVTIA